MSDLFKEISSSSLVSVRDAIVQGKLDLPLSVPELRARGIPAAASEALVRTLGTLPRQPLLDLLDSFIAAHARASRARPRLLWTGPEGQGAQALDTRVQLGKLLREAQRSVFLAGYTFDDPSLFKPLYKAMCERPLKVELVLNIEIPRGDKQTPEDRIRSQVDTFLSKVWPAKDLKPRIFVDPRTARAPWEQGASSGGSYVSMHAKAVVVDELRCIIGSANFTGRGTMRNIEAGVLLENRGFCDALLGQWRGLIAAGVLREVKDQR